MSKVNASKLSEGRLQGLLYQGSEYLVQGISRADYDAWKKDVLHFTAEYFGAESKEYKSFEDIFQMTGECRKEECECKPDCKFTGTLRLATSLLYKYLVKSSRESDSKSESKTENIAENIRSVSEESE
jgi:hypothetical protein